MNRPLVVVILFAVASAVLVFVGLGIVDRYRNGLRQQEQEQEQESLYQTGHAAGYAEGYEVGLHRYDHVTPREISYVDELHLPPDFSSQTHGAEYPNILVDGAPLQYDKRFGTYVHAGTHVRAMWIGRPPNMILGTSDRVAIDRERGEGICRQFYVPGHWETDRNRELRMRCVDGKDIVEELKNGEWVDTGWSSPVPCPPVIEPTTETPDEDKTG